MLPDVVGHRRRYQGVYGTALLQVLAHIGGRDMIDMELYSAAVDALVIGEQEGIVRQCEGAIAVADDELKGGVCLIFTSQCCWNRRICSID